MRERKKKKWVGEGVEKRKDWEKEGGEGKKKEENMGKEKKTIKRFTRAAYERREKP